jgi:hypothetical protein
MDRLVAPLGLLNAACLSEKQQIKKQLKDFFLSLIIPFLSKYIKEY